VTCFQDNRSSRKRDNRIRNPKGCGGGARRRCGESGSESGSAGRALGERCLSDELERTNSRRIITLVYQREAIDKRGGLERIGSLDELREAVIEGAVHRLRPKLLTEGVAIVALAPMLWARRVGHEVISAMAAPVLGGLLIADEVVDLFIPVRFYWIRRARWLALYSHRSVS
jgi:hypothetical protein